MVVRKGIKVDVRVTPYQINDRKRPWIGREESLFSQFFQSNSKTENFRRRVFFADDKKSSLLKHFMALDSFESNDQFLS